MYVHVCTPLDFALFSVSGLKDEKTGKVDKKANQHEN